MTRFTPISFGSQQKDTLLMSLPSIDGSCGQLAKEAEPLDRRIIQLDGLRGIAITSVFLHHALSIQLLWMGVDIFFVLSGFLITGILLNRKGKNQSYFVYFYVRRARRILPPYVLTLIALTFFTTSWLKYWYFYAFFTMNFAAAFLQIPLGTLWSLAVEEQFYLFWPFVVKYVSAKKMLFAAALIVGLAPILRCIFTPWFNTSFPIYFLTPFRMDTLASGAVLAYVYRFHKSWFDRSGRIGVALGCIGLLTLTIISRFPFGRTHSNTSLGNLVIYESTLAVSVAAMILALRGRGIVYTMLILPPLRYIGVISYSIYLIHTIVIDYCRQAFQSHVQSLIATLIITIAYASLSWFVMERPILRSKSVVL